MHGHQHPVFGSEGHEGLKLYRVACRVAHAPASCERSYRIRLDD